MGLKINHRLWGQRVFTLCLAVIFLHACGTSDEDFVQIEKEDYLLYNEAADEMYEGNYRKAAKLFDEIERQHPYSNWAVKGQIMAAFCYYKINDYDEAVIALDRFINLHPGNPDIAYAQYLKALSYYEQIRDISRDQNNSELALKAFRELKQRFPDSVYARDSGKKIDLLIDHLAGKEMEVGRFYQKREDYLAAVNRYRNVIEDYETTVHIAEALYRLIENYLSLGMILEAQKTTAILGYNYPGSDWYQDAYRLLEDNDILQDYDNMRYREARRATFDAEGYLEDRQTQTEESSPDSPPAPSAPSLAREPLTGKPDTLPPEEEDPEKEDNEREDHEKDSDPEIETETPQS